MKKFETRLIDHIPRLRRYARALYSNTCAADDLVQDTLERALIKKSLWFDQQQLRPWLFSIMHNLYVNQVRRQSTTPPHTELDENIRDTRSTPDSLMNAHRLQRCINTLPDEQKAVFLLISLEGFAYEEVARILEIPVGTVMSRLSRARERLRKQLTETEKLPLRRIK